MYLKSSQLIVTLGRALMGVQKRNFWGARIFCTDMRDGYTSVYKHEHSLSCTLNICRLLPVYLTKNF